MITEVTTYYLEMRNPDDFRPKRVTKEGLAITRALIPSPELNRFLYTAVGCDWYWVDRLPWTYHQWQRWVDRSELQTWVAYVSGTPAGYFELESQDGGNVEIASLGLLPSFLGQGLGGHILTVAVETAWLMGASRVWLHTCSLDQPRALNNYRGRGFRVFRESTEAQEVPDQTPGPWPGALGG